MGGPTARWLSTARGPRICLVLRVTLTCGDGNDYARGVARPNASIVRLIPSTVRSIPSIVHGDRPTRPTSGAGARR